MVFYMFNLILQLTNKELLGFGLDKLLKNVHNAFRGQSITVGARLYAGVAER